MNKSSWILVVVVVAVIAFYSGGQRADQLSQGQDDTSLARIKAPVATPEVQTYTQVVKRFQGRRMEFDANCQAEPEDITLKSGQEFLIYNASKGNANSTGNIGHFIRITIDRKYHDIAAGDYKIIKLASSQVSQQYSVTCNANTNVGKILLQANILPE